MKKAVFFCGNCGAKVSQNTSICPVCKHSFSAVKCPKCGFKADSILFKNGCPNCSYLSSSDEMIFIENDNKIKTKKLMPLWIYKTAIIILSFLVVFLIFYLFLPN